MTSAVILTFSLLLLLENVLSLKYPKPSLTNGLKKLWDSDLSRDEKSKREISIRKHTESWRFAALPLRSLFHGTGFIYCKHLGVLLHTQSFR